MSEHAGIRSWFGFQVGLWVAGAAGFEELGEGRGLLGLQAAELVDDDHIAGAAWQPAVGIFGEREVFGFPQFEKVFFTWLQMRDDGRGSCRRFTGSAGFL